MKNGVARVDGSVAVSRAIGDLNYKKYLIPEPETYNYQIQQNDDLLIMSSDGLYLVYTEEQVAQMVYEQRQKGMSLEQIS